MASTPRSGDANVKSGVEVDALIALVGEMTALKKEVNGQAKNLELARAELEHLKHHRRHMVSGDPETASQVESEEGEAKIDDTGKIRRGRDVYCFNESVWDATVFLGLVDGVFESADMIILGVLNVAIQGYFCYLLVSLGLVTLANVFVDDLNDFVDWRLGVAHQAQNYDPITKSSMAQRVCHEYGGTILSNDQQSQFETFDEFYKSRSGKQSDWVQGAGLLTLALLLWLALILKEIVNIFGFCRMLVALSANDIESRCCGLFSSAIFRNSSRTRIVKDDDGNFELLSLSRKRALSIFTFVAVPRTLVAAILGIVGVYYLRGTTSVEEIILNAMALGFVLEIDELLFCFAPSAARSVVSNMAPVPIEIDSQREKELRKSGSKELQKEERVGVLERCLQHVSERSRVLLVILVTVVIVCRVTLIRQVQDSMKIAQVLLCDGNLSFVFTENPSTSVLEISYTVDIPKSEVLPLPVDDLGNVFAGVLQATELCSYFDDETKEYKEIIERLGLCTGADKMAWCDTCEELLTGKSQLSQIRAEIAETVAMTTQSDSEVRASMACVNLFSGVNMTEIYRPFQQLLLAQNFSGEVGACESMFEHCYHSSTQVREIVRLFCPETCLCNSALQASMHPNPWYFNRVGCVPSCGTYITGTEFDNFVQALLIAGEADCYDRDVLEPRENFLPLIADVVEYLVNSEKLLEHTGDDGITRHKPHPLDVVPVFTSYTQQDYTKFQTDNFETSPGMTGCTFVEGADTYLNLTDWYVESNGLCHWATLVSYVFNLNLCSNSLFDEGYTSLSGLCPATCAVGICAAASSTPTALAGLIGGDSPGAWYNIVGWGQERKYNITCDAENFMCLKVVQFHSQLSGGWFDLWLDIDEFPHGSGNSTLIYEGYGNSAEGSETNYACTRRNLTHPSNFSVAAYGWHGSQAARRAIRWQLRDMSDNHLITAGWNRQYMIVGYDWEEVFQETCEQEDVVTYMGSFAEIQATYWLREAWGYGDTNGRGPTGEVEYARRGMFSWETAVVLGDYNAEDDTVLVVPLNMPWIPQATRVARGKLGVPQRSNFTTFQDYKSCAVGSSLLEYGETPMVNGICGSSSSCFDTVQKLQCDITAEMLVLRLQAFGKCDDPVWDYSVVNRTTKLRDICPEQCESQADQTKCPQKLLSEEGTTQGYFGGPHVGQYYFGYYYSFQEPMCMPDGCRCLDTSAILDQCTAEFFTLEHPFHNGHYPQYQYDFETGRYLTGYPVEYRGTLENATRLLSRNTSCFWASEGFWQERQPVEPEGPWCLVDAQQCDSDAYVFQDFPRDNDQLWTNCGWRPAYEEYECQIDPRDTTQDWFEWNYFFVVSETTTTTGYWQMSTGGWQATEWWQTTTWPTGSGSSSPNSAGGSSGPSAGASTGPYFSNYDY